MARQIKIGSMMTLAALVLAVSGKSGAQQNQAMESPPHPPIPPTAYHPVAPTVPIDPRKPNTDISFKSESPPIYPTNELCNGIGGNVVLLVTTDLHGDPIAIAVEHTSRSRALDRAAIEAARHWSFNPGLKNGVAVGDVVRVPVNFKPTYKPSNCPKPSDDQLQGNNPNVLKPGEVPDAARLASLEKSAAQGNIQAERTLGAIYAVGYGVPKDLAKAVMWYQKLAAQGNVQGETNLGVMYARGDGVPRDDVLASAWFTLAARQDGSDSAKVALTTLHNGMTPVQITEAEHLSSSWVKGQLIAHDVVK